MYDASVPVFIARLGSLLKILDKAAAYCEAKKVDPAVLLGTRLTPDMHPLSSQIAMTTMHAHWACALLTGQERPNLPNPDLTIDGMKKRVSDAIAYAQGFTAEQINGSEGRDVKIVFPARTLEFTGQAYLLNFALPNFYFHMTTAYAILREVGVDIGKRDFLG